MDRLIRSPFLVFAALVMVVVVLSLGQAFFVPLALSLLLAFVLAPVVAGIERLGIGRTTAVLAACVAIGLLLAALVGVVSREVVSLASELPAYRENVIQKVETLRGPLGSVERAAAAVTEIEEEIAKPAPGAIKPGSRRPAKVEVVEGLIPTLGGILGPLLDPLGLIAIVAVLAVFMLLQKEDLRDRLIRLAGGQDLSLTTHALDDAGTRIGRYLGMQTLLAGIHGAAITAGLSAIGLPSAILWGVVSALLRFVPYAGPWIAAILPITVALGAFEGWAPALWTVGLLVAIELVSNNVLEPWFYGSSVGLSPFAIVVSAVFWSWLWGLPGLLLATPISACLVVIGHHVRGLQFFVILLSDEPALEPDVRLYQRLLAHDLEEAEAILRSAPALPDMDYLSDRIVLPALRRLADDRASGILDADEAAELRVALADLLDEVSEKGAVGVSADADATARPAVLCIPALGPDDELASRWVASALRQRGIQAASVSADVLVNVQAERAVESGADAICISALTPAAEMRARHLCKRLATHGSTHPIVLGAWASAMSRITDRSSPALASRPRRVSSIAEAFDQLGAPSQPRPEQAPPRGDR